VIGIAAVVALMIIVPILASILSPGPNAPSSIIRIDGDFSDWANMASYGQSAADVTPNPAVHLVTMKVATQDQNLFVYTRVQGNMFQGTAVNETDSIFVFVDEDNNRNTATRSATSERIRWSRSMDGMTWRTSDMASPPSSSTKRGSSDRTIGTASFLAVLRTPHSRVRNWRSVRA